MVSPILNLPWMTSGSQWIEIASTFEGEEFGESTYTYELRILPIERMPRSDEATEDQVEIHDLTEGGVIHVTATVNDVDGGAGDGDNRIGMWSTNPKHVLPCWPRLAANPGRSQHRLGCRYGRRVE